MFKQKLILLLVALALLIAPALTSRTSATPAPRFDCAGQCLAEIDPFIQGCVWAGG